MEAVDGFSDLDRSFSDLTQDPELKQFFCQLMTHARSGHLCLRSQHQWVAEFSGSTIPMTPIVRDQDRYYIQRNWVLETAIVNHFLRLRQATPRQLFDRPPTISPQLQKRQAEALQSVFQNSLTLVSGGPGTGKTFTAVETIRSLSKISRLRIKIAAPTGKAADRLAFAVGEGLDLEAMTLHRLLNLQPGRCRLFSQKKIDADLIVVDEASMVDASLFAHLLAAIPDGARLMLLGDADQLPPIDGGGVFADLSQLFAIQLQVCHRTNDTQIQELYEAARQGHVNPFDMVLEPLPQDFLPWLEPMLGPVIFEERPNPIELLERFNRLRIICPLRRGSWGIDAMNAALLQQMQRRLRSGQWWAAPILVTDNDSHLQIYNGTSGIVVGQAVHGLLLRGSEEVVLSDGRSLILDQLPNYEIAFALSVHKSQGSEFDHVICCLPQGSEEFGRECLYTAITRAKKSIRLAGDRTTLEKMLALRSHQENGILERIANGC